MNTKDSFKANIPKLKIDKSLEQYNGKVLFPKKLEEANNTLKRVGVPDPETTITYSEFISKK